MEQIKMKRFSKKFTVIIIVAVVVLGFVVPKVVSRIFAAPVTNWYNASATTFTLTTADQLAGLAKLVNDGTATFEGKTIFIGADISNLMSSGFATIGNGTNEFKGTFNGQGHSISGLTGNTPLFYNIPDITGITNVQNIKLDVNISVNNISQPFGGIARTNKGIISGCFVSGAISRTGGSNTTDCGGIVGTNTGTIKQCGVSASVTSTTS